jgi:hypothetical protein
MIEEMINIIPHSAKTRAWRTKTKERTDKKTKQNSIDKVEKRMW